MWKRVLVVGCGPVLVVLGSMWILRPSSAQSPTVAPRDRALTENARSQGGGNRHR
jgi:hypothetical protein